MCCSPPSLITVLAKKEITDDAITLKPSEIVLQGVDALIFHLM